VGERLANDTGIDAAGLDRVGERRLKGKGVGVEPVEEGRAAEDTRIRVLRSMDVSV